MCALMWMGSWWLDWATPGSVSLLWIHFLPTSLFFFRFSLNDLNPILFLDFNIFSPLPSTHFLSLTCFFSKLPKHLCFPHRHGSVGIACLVLFPFLFFFPPSLQYAFSFFQIPLLNHFSGLVFAEPLSSELSLLLTVQHPLGWLSPGCVGTDWEWISSSVLRRELTIYLLSDDFCLSTSISSDHFPNKTIYNSQIYEQKEC